MTPTPTTPGAVPPPGRGRSTRIVLGLLLVFAALFALGTLPRLARQRELRAEVQTRTEAALVRVVAVRRGGTASEFTLPGTAQALREAPIYARSTGYVRRWFVDIGARVAPGQLLAELETPEVDQEIAQARASLARSRSSETLARTTLERLKALVRDSAATPQELDERQAAYEAAQATVAAEEANVRRLGELQAFGRVTAPFGGTITARNLEQGGLVSAGTSGGAKPLFVVAQADTVRIFVNVPENAATAVRTGLVATVTVRDLPGREFKGRVSRTSGALDPATRTMLAQVDVPNPGNVLFAGMYAQVALATTRAVPAILVPANALVIRPEGPQVATVRDGKVHFVMLQLGRDLGTELEVISGNADGDQVIINPSDEVVEGAPVRVAPADAPNEAAEKGAGGAKKG
jgi:RND family efflux transporter MFP subunit